MQEKFKMFVCALFAVALLASIIFIDKQLNIISPRKTALTVMNNPYIIDAILYKQRDGKCLSKWEIEYVNLDKWLTDEERNAIFEQDLKCNQ